MLCDNCKERDAVVHLTRIVENAVTQLHLCEKCAAAKGVETTLAMPQHPLGDILQAVQQQASATSEDAPSCAFCGSSSRDFKATGRLGCPHCYDAMERSLRELLRRLHGSSKHVGEVAGALHRRHLHRATTSPAMRGASRSTPLTRSDLRAESHGSPVK